MKQKKIFENKQKHSYNIIRQKIKHHRIYLKKI